METKGLLRSFLWLALAAGLAACAHADESVDHPAAQAAAERLEWEAVELLKQDRVAEATPLLEKSAELWEVAAGTNTRQHYRALGYLQNAYYRLERYAQMLRVMERRLDIARMMFGERHEQAILSMRNVAGGYDAVGRHDEARRMREAADKLASAP